MVVGYPTAVPWDTGVGYQSYAVTSQGIVLDCIDDSEAKSSVVETRNSAAEAKSSVGRQVVDLIDRCYLYTWHTTRIHVSG